MKYQIVSGLETHIELATASKVFCSCRTDFGGEPNTHCCPVCTGQPGSIPVLNRKALEYAIMAGLATHCTINRITKMDRKNYVYPDLPKAYQISQFDEPICEHGYIELDSGKKIGITRIHLEEDAGKLVHENGYTYVDYNRGGVPLIEVVSEPDISSIDEAKEYIEKLQLIMRHIGISDCKMQEGSFRCDVNISIMPEGSTKLGTRTEIKNMNSLTFIVKAMEYEYERQVDVIESGGKVEQTTLRYDDVTGTTSPMRGKEDAQDYRYFMEPDLLTIEVSQATIDKLKAALPELPDDKKKRLMESLGLTAQDAALLVKYRKVSEFYDAVTSFNVSAKHTANFILGSIFRTLANEQEKEEFNIKTTAEQLANLIKLIDENKINVNMAKNALKQMLETGSDYTAFISEADCVKVDESELIELCKQAIAANEKAVADYRNGKTIAIKALIGFIMKATKGKANAVRAEELIIELIG